MKKLMLVVLMLFILTMSVSGASAVPEKNTHSTQIAGSVSNYAKTYATGNEDGYAAQTIFTYASVDFDKNYDFTGYTHSTAIGGPGTYVTSGQAITGTISTSTGPI